MEQTTDQTKQKENKIEPIAPELGINYASSPLLEYAYPPINETIAKNILNAIIAVPKLYTQVLHLMNKMNLPPPFGPARKRPAFPESNSMNEQRRDEIKYYGKSQIPEKEVEEEEDVEFEDKKQELDNSLPLDNPFSKTPTIAVSVPPKTTSSMEVSSIQTNKVVSIEKTTVESMFVTPASVRNCISRQDILKHRISKEEMSQHKAFANYAYGDPNSKLFIRNLPKDSTEEDILKIFGCFFDNDDEAKRQLEIKIMTGRMKGQAFVTFPTIESAREALVTVNGYIFKEKPIVVCFGKQS